MINKKIITFKKTIKYQLLQIVLFFIYFSLSSELYGIIKIDFYNEISITINQKGKHFILSKGISTYTQYTGPMPNEVYINGVIQ